MSHEKATQHHSPFLRIGLSERLLADKIAMFETNGSDKETCCAESTMDFATMKQSELIRDQLLSVLQVEKSYCVTPVPCLRATLIPDDERVPLEDWRRKICQWSFRVIDHFRLDREVVSTGMNLFDRFLTLHSPPEQDLLEAVCHCPSCKQGLSSQMYQLAAMTCIFLAVKLHTENASASASRHEVLPKRRHHFRLATFVELSRGQFRAQDICEMEQTVLKVLQWRVSPPTPMTCVSYLTTLLPDKEALPESSQPFYDLVVHVLRELSRYLTELAVCMGGECTYYSPSQVAYASILVSMDLLTTQALPLSTRTQFRRQVLEVCGQASQLLHGPSIMALCSTLQQALWPEMLLDTADEHASEAGHPISIARDYGLLDMDRIYHQRAFTIYESPSMMADTLQSDDQELLQQRTPPTSPKRPAQPQVSPVSVAHSR